MKLRTKNKNIDVNYSNFKNNQLYIKNEYFWNKLSFLMKLYLFWEVILRITTVEVFILLIIAQLPIINWNIITNTNWMYYTNNNTFLIYLWVIFLFFSWIYTYKFSINSIKNNKVDLKKIYNFKTTFLWSVILIFVSLFFYIKFWLKYSFIVDLYIYSFIFIIWYFFINIFLLLKIDLWLFIKKPFKGYTNIKNSIKKNNIKIYNTNIKKK